MNKQPNSFHCFICGVKNISGVQVRFYDTIDDDGQPEVLAVFEGRSHHQGYPGRMHGGVAMGILDETIGRAIYVGEPAENPTAWGVTVDFSLRFRQPVPLDAKLTARGRVTNVGQRIFEGSGELYLPDGSVAVKASGKYIKMALDEISDIDPETLGWRVYDDLEASVRR